MATVCRRLLSALFHKKRATYVRSHNKVNGLAVSYPPYIIHSTENRLIMNLKLYNEPQTQQNNTVWFQKRYAK